MSLINKMLRDLDARRAPAADRMPLPSGVYTAQRRPERNRLRGVVLGVGVVAIAAGGAWYWLSGESRMPSPQAAPALQAVPQTSPQMASPPLLQPQAQASNAAAGLPLPTAAPMAPPPQAAAIPQPYGVVPAATASGQPRVMATAQVPAAAASPVATPRPVMQAQSVSPAPQSAAKSAAFLTGKPIGAKPAPAVAGSSAGSPNGAGASIEKRPHGTLANEAAENEYNKAIAALRRGADSEAVAGLHAALRLDASHVSARQALLSMLVRMQRYAEAQTLAAEGLAVVPDQAGWALALARLQAGNGKLAEASETLARHARYAGRDADYQAVSAVLMQKQKRFQEAVDFYRAALGLRGSESRWWYGLGVSLEHVDQPQEARAAFQRAKEIGNLPPELATGVERHLR